MRTDESAKNITERDFEEKSDLEKKVQTLPVNTSCEEKQDQVLTFEENGRFGNLLMETATLLLIGRKLNKRVQLLPDVSKKLRNYFSSLPAAETVDFSKVNLKVQTLSLVIHIDILDCLRIVSVIIVPGPAKAGRKFLHGPSCPSLRNLLRSHTSC